MQINISPGEQDMMIAGGLVTAPAWGSWLQQLNLALTTLSLLIGLALGAARLWLFLKDRRRARR